MTVADSVTLPQHGLVHLAQVSFKCTDFLADQVLLGGFAAGGLSQVRDRFPLPMHRSTAFAQVC
jgi:hypothetical protein